MGLDSFLRSVPKNELDTSAKARHSPLHKTLPLVSYKYYRKKHEIAYWRGNKAINGWMEELYRHKYPEDSPPLYNPFYLLLDAEDILSLKMEMMFGSVAPRPTWEAARYDWHYGHWEDGVLPPNDNDTASFDRALRIIRNNRSYIYYTSSW